MIRWFFGWLVAAILVWHGIHSCLVQEMSLPGRYMLDHFRGMTAFFFGFGAVGLGFLLHAYALDDFYDAHPTIQHVIKVIGYALFILGTLSGVTDALWRLVQQQHLGI